MSKKDLLDDDFLEDYDEVEEVESKKEKKLRLKEEKRRKKEDFKKLNHHEKVITKGKSVSIQVNLRKKAYKFIIVLLVINYLGFFGYTYHGSKSEGSSSLESTSISAVENIKLGVSKYTDIFSIVANSNEITTYDGTGGANTGLDTYFDTILDEVNPAVEGIHGFFITETDGTIKYDSDNELTIDNTLADEGMYDEFLIGASKRPALVDGNGTIDLSFVPDIDGDEFDTAVFLSQKVTMNGTDRILIVELGTMDAFGYVFDSMIAQGSEDFDEGDYTIDLYIENENQTMFSTDDSRYNEDNATSAKETALIESVVPSAKTAGPTEVEFDFADTKNRIGSIIQFSTDADDAVQLRTVNDIYILTSYSKSSLYLESALYTLLETALLGIFVGVVVIVSKKILSISIDSLQETCVALEEIADGEGDLTNRLDVKTSDESGRIAFAFNKFTDKIADMVKMISTESERLVDISKSVKNSNDQILTSNETVSLGVVSVSASLEEGSVSLSHSAEELVENSKNLSVIAASTEEVAATITNVASTSEEISSGATEVSSVLNNLASNFNDINDSNQLINSSVLSVKNAVQAFDVALRGINDSCNVSKDVSVSAEKSLFGAEDVVRNMTQLTEKIGDAVADINTITERTNMLALNATIEAATAGENGAGFTVVANEIKDLAEQTREVTNNIHKRIKELEFGMKDTTEAINEIAEIMTKMMETNNYIATSVEKQTAITSEVVAEVNMTTERISSVANRLQEATESQDHAVQSLTEITDGVHDIARSTSQISVSSSEASSTISRLSESLDTISISTKGTVIATNEIEKSMSNVSVSVDSTRKEIDTSVSKIEELENITEKLKESVSKFKV